MSEKAVVVKTGIANTASVIAGLKRAGLDPIVSSDLMDIRDSHRVILPGVGAFGHAVSELKENGIIDTLKERITVGKPTLAVCLGFQLLFFESEESPGVEGIGVLPCKIRRFPDNLPVPQFGWNKVEADESCRLLQDGYAYFANSYRLPTAAPTIYALNDWGKANAEYGDSFVAAVERGAILGCQFHPELSGHWGINLIKRWAELSGEY